MVGNVSVSSYEAKDGTTRFSLDVYAEDVEFLSPREEKRDNGAFEPSDADETDAPFDPDDFLAGLD